MSYQKERTIRRDRMALLRERVAALKEESATMNSKEQFERYLEDAKKQMRTFNSHFILSN